MNNNKYNSFLFKPSLMYKYFYGNKKNPISINVKTTKKYVYIKNKLIKILLNINKDKI